MKLQVVSRVRPFAALHAWSGRGSVTKPSTERATVAVFYYALLLIRWIGPSCRGLVSR